MTTSTLFLNYITCVDHAFIDKQGRVVGGSYHPNFEVTGEVEAVENVVVDFSRVKKEIKGLVDDKAAGFDHKLWFIPGFSNGSIFNVDGETIQIETPAVNLIMPRNAVKVFTNFFDGSFIDTVEKEFNEYLTTNLGNLHPDLNITVETEITSDTFSRTHNHVLFRYSHGLKNSSSWGCQNHSHGHLSFVEFQFKQTLFPPTKREQVYESARNLDNTLFIFKDNVVEETDGYVKIEYTTPRGYFAATYNKTLMKVQILETETTIEHIVDWYVNQNRDLFLEAGVQKVYVSEGLAKGAVVKL